MAQFAQKTEEEEKLSGGCPECPRLLWDCVTNVLYNSGMLVPINRPHVLQRYTPQLSKSV